ncbi:hypothetical protein D3C80_1263200 [compost metagenome]
MAPSRPACAGPAAGCLRPRRFPSPQGVHQDAQAARPAHAGNSCAPCHVHHARLPSQPTASSRPGYLHHAPGRLQARLSPRHCGLVPATAAQRPGSYAAEHAAPARACPRSRSPEVPPSDCPEPRHHGRWTPGTGRGHSALPDHVAGAAPAWQMPRRPRQCALGDADCWPADTPAKAHPGPGPKPGPARGWPSTSPRAAGLRPLAGAGAQVPGCVAGWRTAPAAVVAGCPGMPAPCLATAPGKRASSHARHFRYPAPYAVPAGTAARQPPHRPRPARHLPSPATRIHPLAVAGEPAGKVRAHRARLSPPGPARLSSAGPNTGWTTPGPSIG